MVFGTEIDETMEKVIPMLEWDKAGGGGDATITIIKRQYLTRCALNFISRKPESSVRLPLTKNPVCFFSCPSVRNAVSRLNGSQVPFEVLISAFTFTLETIRISLLKSLLKNYLDFLLLRFCERIV